MDRSICKVSIGTNRINMRTVIHLNVQLTTLSTAVVMEIGSVLAFTPTLSIFIYTFLNLNKTHVVVQYFGLISFIHGLLFISWY